MSDHPRPNHYDLAVVGAGPAGLAAASLAARSGLATAIFDDRSKPGGHAYGAISRQLVDQFLSSGAAYFPRSVVRAISPELDLDITVEGAASAASARSVIVATGAVERSVAIPGRELPGVMMAGEAQARVLAGPARLEGRVVLAGSGWLLWTIAAQCLDQDVPIVAVLDTTPRANRRSAWRHVLGFAFSPHLGEMVRTSRAVRRGARVVRDVVAVEACGSAALDGVWYRTAKGDEHVLPADALLLHQGIVPNTELAKSTGVLHRWSDQQAASLPMADRYGGTSAAGVLVAGDAAHVSGAQSAAWRGVLAAIAVIRAMQPGQTMAVERLAWTAVARFDRGRKYIDALYRPVEPVR